MEQTKVILVTGASSGIGRFCAEHLAGLGYRVFGTSRQPDGVQVPGVTMLPLDVTDDESVQEVVTAVLGQVSRLDVLINNAGAGIAGPIEDTPLAEARWQFDVNFFGALRMCQAVLPVMRQQESGLIINMSSLMGQVALPFQGLYSASKFALEGLSEALRMEVKPWGINVALVQPGDFHTGFTASRRLTPVGPAYAERCRKAMAVIESDEESAPPPTAVAQTVAKIIQTKSPKLRYRVGSLEQRFFTAAKPIIPSGIYESLVMDHYGGKG